MDGKTKNNKNNNNINTSNKLKKVYTKRKSKTNNK